MESKPLVILLTTSTLAVLFTGCAASRPASLDRAQTSLQQARQDPLVVQNAPTYLNDAQATLTRAEQEWADNHDRDEVSHLAYMSEQKAGIAVAMAQQKVAETETQQLLAQRDAIRLSARSHEVEQVRERAQSLEQELAALKAKETERGLVMTLQENVLFETNKAELKPGAMRNLYPLITFLKDHSNRTLMIEGHTDSTGSSSYNLDLSQRRAEAVRSFLVMNGINSDRVTAQGYGKDYPVTTNATEVGRAQNRRVEMVISQEGQKVVGR